MVNISHIRNLHQGNRNVRALDKTIKSEYKDYIPTENTKVSQRNMKMCNFSLKLPCPHVFYFFLLIFSSWCLQGWCVHLYTAVLRS